MDMIINDRKVLEVRMKEGIGQLEMGFEFLRYVSLYGKDEWIMKQYKLFTEKYEN